MGYYVLWLEQLAAALLWIAVMLAWSARWKRGWIRWLVIVLAVVAPLSIYVLVAFAAGYLKYHALVDTGVLLPFILLSVVFLSGAITIIVVGRRRAITWPAMRLAACALLALFLNFATFWNLDAAVLQRLASLRAEASAMAASVAPIRVVDSENAAFLYDQAFEAIQADTEWPREQWEAWWEAIVHHQPLDVSAPQVSQLLKRHAGTLRLLREAARRPACYFDRDYTRPSIDILLPELVELRHAAQLLLINARYQAAQGDLAAAIEDINTAMGISRHLSNEPFLIGCLVTVVIHNAAIRTLDEVVDGHSLNDHTLMALQLENAIPFRRLMGKSLRLEEAFGLSIFTELDSRDDFFGWVSGIAGGNADSIPGTASLYRVFFLSQDLQSYRQQLSAAQGLAQGPFYRTSKRWEEYEKNVETDRGGIICALLLPALSSMGHVTVEADGYQAVGRVSVAVLRYRAREGMFPHQLSQLTPDLLPFVPLDPATGESLVYQRSDNGFVLYSLGPDQVDDGGQRMDRNRREGDIVFQYQE